MEDMMGEGAAADNEDGGGYKREQEMEDDFMWVLIRE